MLAAILFDHHHVALAPLGDLVGPHMGGLTHAKENLEGTYDDVVSLLETRGTRSVIGSCTCPHGVRSIIKSFNSWLDKSMIEDGVGICISHGSCSIN